MPQFIGKTNERNVINATDQDDRIKGGEDIDFISGGAGNDRIFGNGGNDFLNGGAGDDRIFGGDGNDLILGGAGNDRLDGGAGADTMQGGDGEDMFIMGDGDFAKGGNDADTFIWRLTAEQTINISDFSAQEGDVMKLWGSGRYDWETIENDNFTTVAFENGAQVNFYGYSAEEIMENSDLFGL